MKAAIYLRVSTSGQAGADHVSLAVQESTCRDFINRQGGAVSVVLRDEGRSGLDSDRPAYQQLFELARQKTIDAVVVFRLDRLGRDAAEFLTASRRLRSFGCQVHSATEPTENNLVAGIIALLAEDESMRIRARTMPAMVARMQSGRWVGRAPRGYRIVPHPEGGATLEPTDEAWKVRRLFELYAGGSHSLASLQRETVLLELTDRELGMTRSHIFELLTNPAYIGRVVWGRKAKERIDGKKTSHRRQRNAWHEYDGAHPAIVSDELFDQVQAQLAKNKRTQGPPPRNRQLLVSRIYCRCGSRMAAKPSQYGKKGQIYYCYFCLRKSEDRTVCSQPQVSCRIIDAAVKERVMATFRIGPNEREAAREIIASSREDHLTGLAQRKRQLQQAQRRLENERQSLARHLVQGVVRPDVYQNADAGYASQLDAIAAELQDLVGVEIPDVSGVLDLVYQIDWRDLDQEEWREALDALVERVDLDDRTPSIVWRDGTEALRRILEAVR